MGGVLKFYKLISTLLHPIVIPFIGVLLYFLLFPTRLTQMQKLAILGFVFIATYLIPLLLLVLLKALGQIKSYKIKEIKERKFPVMFMIVLYYLLGNTFFTIAQIRDLGVLFYAASLSLLLVYLLFLFRTKTSIHLLSMGIGLGFFLLLNQLYLVVLLPVILVIILLSGILASARLHLKAHTAIEVYLGFFIGFICPFLVYQYL